MSRSRASGPPASGNRRETHSPDAALTTIFSVVHFGRFMTISNTSAHDPVADRFRMGEWTVCQSRNVIERDGAETRLEPRVMDVLVYLARRAPDPVTKQELAEAVWGVQFISDDALTVTLSALRKALCDNAREPRYIETISRRGYRVIAPVVAVASSDAGAPRPMEPQSPSRFPRGAVLASGAIVLFGVVSIRMLSGGQHSPHATSAEAHEAYVKGRYFLDQRSIHGWRQGLEQFRRAVALDPKDPASFAGLADAYSTMSDFGVASPAELRPKAMEAANRALALDAKSPEAHEARGRAAFLFDWDFAGAERHLKEAIAENPDYMPAHQTMAWVQSARGRFPEAIAAARTALQLDPVNTARYVELAWVLGLAGQYQQALRQTDRALEVDPRSLTTYLMKGWILERAAYPDSAFSVYMSGWRVAGVPSDVIRSTQISYRAHGLAGFYRNWLAHGSSGGPLSDTFRAQLYARIGDRDHAMQALERAYQKREGALAWINVEPTFESLRAEPSFRRLAARVIRQ